MNSIEDFRLFDYISPKDIAFIIALITFIIVAEWKVFQKAGQPGWAVLVPFYNFYIMLKIVGKPGWWLLLLFVPFVNVVIGFYVIHLLSLSFGKNLGFSLGLIFLSFIFYPILGYGDAKYKGTAGAI